MTGAVYLQPWFCSLHYPGVVRIRTMSSSLSHDWVESAQPLDDEHLQRLNHSALLYWFLQSQSLWIDLWAHQRKQRNSPTKCIHSFSVHSGSLTYSSFCLLKTSSLAHMQNFVSIEMCFRSRGTWSGMLMMQILVVGHVQKQSRQSPISRDLATPTRQILSNSICLVKETVVLRASRHTHLFGMSHNSLWWDWPTQEHRKRRCEPAQLHVTWRCTMGSCKFHNAPSIHSPPPLQWKFVKRHH